MINFGNYRRLKRKISWISDCPKYVYGSIKKDQPIKPVFIKRYSQLLGFYPSIVFENRYLIRNFEKPKEIIAKV